MPGVSRVGVDTAGGLIIGDLSPSVIVNGVPIVVQGAAIQSHGDSPHNSAVMVDASSTIEASGIPICREGDAASCGHTATGSSDVIGG